MPIASYESSLSNIVEFCSFLSLDENWTPPFSTLNMSFFHLHIYLPLITRPVAYFSPTNEAYASAANDLWRVFYLLKVRSGSHGNRDGLLTRGKELMLITFGRAEYNPLTSARGNHAHNRTPYKHHHWCFSRACALIWKGMQRSLYEHLMWWRPSVCQSCITIFLPLFLVSSLFNMHICLNINFVQMYVFTNLNHLDTKI